jgi:hypothetical protein
MQGRALDDVKWLKQHQGNTKIQVRTEQGKLDIDTGSLGMVLIPTPF